MHRLKFSLTRLILIVIVITTLVYLMTGLVYFEGCFEGALVVKPYPIYGVVFGGGEAGTWARHHPGEPLPWFMQENLKLISKFSWEEGGDPGLVTIYELGFLATFLAWIVLAVIAPVKLLMGVRARIYSPPLSIR